MFSPEIISEAHLSKHVEFPLDVVHAEEPLDKFHLLQERATGLSEVRWSIVENMGREYGPNSDKAISAVILAMLGPHVDAISLSQLQYVDEGAFAWEVVDPQNTHALQKEFSRIRVSRVLSSYLSRNPEVDESLDVIHAVASSNDPIQLFSYQKMLEALGKKQFARGVPTLIWVMSPDGLWPDAPLGQPPILIPDLRHLYPDPETNSRFLFRVQHVLHDLHQLSWLGKFVMIAHLGAATGNSIWWQASGENLYSPGLLIGINIMEGHAKHFSRFCNYFGEDTVKYKDEYFNFYMLHEKGHDLWPAEVRFVEEFAVNGHITSFIFNRILNEPNNAKQRALFAAFIYQNCHLMNFQSSDTYLDGYNFSNAIIINTLTEFGLLGVNGNGDLLWNIDKDKLRQVSDFLWNMSSLAVAAKIQDPINDIFVQPWSEDAKGVCRAIDKICGL